MALNETNLPGTPPKQGSGGIGSIIGGLVGAIGGALAGGYLAPAGATIGATIGAAGAAASAGFGVGSTAGSLIGNQIDPGKEGTLSGQGISQISSAAQNRLMQDPRAVVASLNEGISSLKQQDQKLASAVEPYLVAARSRAMGLAGG
jgi:hypothetical protein